MNKSTLYSSRPFCRLRSLRFADGRLLRVNFGKHCEPLVRESSPMSSIPAHETTPETTTTAVKPRRRWWVVVLVWLGISAVSVVVVGAGLYGVFLWNAKEELAAEIAHV